MAKANTHGFRVLPSYYEAIRDLPDNDRLALYDAIWDYGFGNDVADLSPVLKGFFALIMPTLQNSVRFEEKQVENGRKGGRPKNPSKTQIKPKRDLGKPKGNLDIDVDVDVDSDIDIDIEGDIDNASLTGNPSTVKSQNIPFEDIDIKNAVMEWLNYKREKKRPCTPSEQTALFGQVQKAVDTYGKQAVIDIISTSMASGYKGIIFDRLAKAKTAPRKTAPKEYRGESFLDDLQI